MKPLRLTALARQRIAAHLRNGDLAIDATVGNGHDTLMLASGVAPRGHVIGFDIQTKALDAARSRLVQAGLLDNVTLKAHGHERLLDELPDDWSRRVSVVMFNLGYLPGGDKRIITCADTTLAALDQACEVIRPGGLVSLMLYRGHAGADSETHAVESWVDGLNPELRVETFSSPGPVLYLIQYGAHDLPCGDV